MAFPGMKASEWDIHAKEYAAMDIENLMSAPCKRLLSELNTASSLSSATAILDVGCGPGTMIAHLVKGYGSQIPSSSRIIASDFSSGMVDCVREKQKERIGKEADINGAWTRLETEVLDAPNLEGIKEGEMSHIMGSMVYFMLPNPRAGLKEAHRVLKDGGALCLTAWSKVEWMDLLQTAAWKVNPNAPSGFDVKKLGAWTSIEGVKGEFEACGFKDVKTEYVPADMPMKDPKMFVNGFIKSQNPGTKMVVGLFSPEDLEKVCEEFLKLVEGKEKLEGILIVASGKK